MRAKRPQSTAYNLLFPLWLLVWWPSWLWLLLIPGNYLVDRLVLHLSLGARDRSQGFCRQHTWKVCLAGFASDFAASAALLAISLLLDALDSPALYDIGSALTLNPFSHGVALLITLAAIAGAAGLIFLLDRTILGRAGLSAEQARRCALHLAVVTAPYLFLVPSEVLYG